MISVHVKRNRKNNVVSFTLEGHAESGPYGYDLVCASVTAVTFGMINSLEALCGLDADAITEQTNEGGFLRCTIPFIEVEDVQEKIHYLMESMLVCLQTIQASYSEHIKIIDSGGVQYVKA